MIITFIENALCRSLKARIALKSGQIRVLLLIVLAYLYVLFPSDNLRLFRLEFIDRVD